MSLLVHSLTVTSDIILLDTIIMSSSCFIHSCLRRTSNNWKEIVQYMLSMFPTLSSISLPPANEVWGKVICLQVCVCLQGGAIPACIAGGIPACLAAGLQGGLQAHTQGGSWGGSAWGVPAPGRCLVLGWGCLVLGGGCLLRGGCLVEIPPDSYCCGRYASYWNAFLYGKVLSDQNVM